MRLRAVTRGAKLASLLTAALFVLGPAAPSVAHGGDSEEARLLVLQALAYLANEPDDYLHRVEEKIDEALEVRDTSGVEISKVETAREAFEAGSLAEVRNDLQAAVLPLTEPVTGEATGTTTMLDPYDGETDWAGAGGILAGLSAVVLLAGVALSYRWRPEQSLSQLRQSEGDGQQ